MKMDVFDLLIVETHHQSLTLITPPPITPLLSLYSTS
eukprot:UN12674